MTLAPRPYQLEALEAIAAAYVRGITRPMLVMATGGGKTVVFAHLILRRPGCALVLAHRKELIGQAADKIRMVVPDIDIGVVKAERDERDHACVVASVQTLAQEKRLARFERDAFRTIIADECFPAGTLVDGVPIENISVGDNVRSVDHDTGDVILRPVTHVFRRRASALVKIFFADGTDLICTPEHPVFTRDKRTGAEMYLPARMLSCYNMAYSIINKKGVYTNGERGISSTTMCCLRDHIQAKTWEGYTCYLLGDMQTCKEGRAKTVFDSSMCAMWDYMHSAGISEEQCFKNRAGILLGRMQGEVPSKNFIGNNGKNEQNIRLIQDERKKSDAEPCLQGQAADNLACNGMETSFPRGKWKANSCPSTIIGFSSWLGNGICDSNRDSQKARISHLLQSGHCRTNIENCNRGRWRKPPCFGEKITRQKEGKFLGIIGVESIEISKSSGYFEFGGMCEEGLVYNLEVEGTNNYFANGILVHNCHHAIKGSSYERIMDYFGAFAEQDPPLCLGVTATPFRGGKEALGDIWQEIVYRKELQEMIAEGYLSPIRALHLQLEDLDLRKIKKTGGDYQDDALGQAISAANGPLLVSQAWQEHAQGRQTLLFTPTIELAGEMAAAFMNAGVPAESLNYLVNDQDRDSILSRYENEETRVLCNPACLTEGFDSPQTSCVAICRPTRSKNLFIQMIGRGTRLYPGKEDALIMDLSGCSKIHDLVTLEALFKSEDKEEPPADDEEEVEESEGNGGPPGVRPHYLTGKLNVEEVDIFARRGEAFHWLLVFDKPKPLWVLPLGKDWVCLGKACSDPGVDRWSVFTLTGRGEQAFLDTPYSLPRGYGQGIAEDLVRRNGDVKLAKPNAWWRKSPASEKQRQMVSWLGGQAGDITAGMASDMITRLKVMQALRRVMERMKHDES